MITENRIKQIVLQEVKKLIETENNTPNGWHTWAETDAANGLTPKQGKEQRMQQPGNSVRPSDKFRKKDEERRIEFMANNPNTLRPPTNADIAEFTKERKKAKDKGIILTFDEFMKRKRGYSV